MKKLLLLCAMSTMAVNLYGAASSYRYEGSELIRPGGLPYPAAKLKASQMVEQYGQNLDDISRNSYILSLAGAYALGNKAVDWPATIIDAIQTANRIFAANPGKGYADLTPQLQGYLEQLPSYDAKEIAAIKRDLQELGY